MGFSPLIQWQNLIYFAGDKRGEGLLCSLACLYSAPVLYKPDNKYGTRQGCPLWKELFSTKVIMLDQCSPNSRLKRHTQRWSSASKYVTALGFFLMVQQAKVHTTYLQLCGCFYSAHTIHLSQLSEKWHAQKKQQKNDLFVHPLIEAWQIVLVSFAHALTYCISLQLNTVEVNGI